MKSEVCRFVVCLFEDIVEALAGEAPTDLPLTLMRYFVGPLCWRAVAGLVFWKWVLLFGIAFFTKSLLEGLGFGISN